MSFHLHIQTLANKAHTQHLLCHNSPTVAIRRNPPARSQASCTAFTDVATTSREYVKSSSVVFCEIICKRGKKYRQRPKLHHLLCCKQFLVQHRSSCSPRETHSQISNVALMTINALRLPLMRVQLISPFYTS